MEMEWNRMKSTPYAATLEYRERWNVFAETKKWSVLFNCFFKNMISVECNYEVYDKKLFAIIRCFEEWRLELKTINLSVKIFTDYKSFEYFMIIKKLIKRQIRWSKFLSQYNFVIMCQFDAQNVKINALIRRSND